MIERHHYFRLQAEAAEPPKRAELAKKVLSALSPLPGVLGVRVGLPADDHAEAAWDLMVVVQFAALEDVEAYRANEEHRRFVDEVLAPTIDVKKIWNFTVETSSD